MGTVSEGEYMGKKIIIIKNSETDRFPFQFGLRKAKMVVDHIEEIKKFVEKYGHTEPSTETSHGTAGDDKAP